MSNLDKNAASITLKIETHDLSPVQVRLLKHVHTLLVHTVTAEDEAEYFEASSELLKQACQLIVNASFPATKGQHSIAYASQAIEYALDTLSEDLAEKKLTNFDN